MINGAADDPVARRTLFLEAAASRSGQPVGIDIRRPDHLLLAGAEGTGKSMVLRRLVRRALDAGADVHVINTAHRDQVMAARLRQLSSFGHDIATAEETLTAVLGDARARLNEGSVEPPILVVLDSIAEVVSSALIVRLLANLAELDVVSLVIAERNFGRAIAAAIPMQVLDRSARLILGPAPWEQQRLMLRRPPGNPFNDVTTQGSIGLWESVDGPAQIVDLAA